LHGAFEKKQGLELMIESLPDIIKEIKDLKLI